MSVNVAAGNSRMQLNELRRSPGSPRRLLCCSPPLRSCSVGQAMIATFKQAGWKTMSVEGEACGGR